MKTVLVCVIVGCVMVNPVLAQSLTGEEILRKIDDNLYVEEGVSLTTMIIHGRTGDRTVTSKNWFKGKEQSFVEYLSPAREKGKKMLKLEDKIWTYTPEPTDRIITISGHLLRQSVMGSDLSYEDMTENDKLIELYDAVVEGEERLNGRQCYVVKLTAKEQGATYHSRQLWVDAERWLPLQEERYAKSGRLLKTITIEEVFQVDGRWYPKKMIFKDMLAKGKGTEYIIDSIDFDADVPDYMLTKAALRK
ncbi:outer membrane lipoprotein-sorting protein [candidate division KSB3 bacterium]|uniref:Outer membrane lipoprotein-sorting protein n=1 Tax=candidate division KSB3 bacterium TaxID=2044937 RepID=A0A9D5Q402_9BACT|nr:outer membrane lipoprotein-sorting protein [candidate division KSB3 bacterium]MBD3323040.1 outer membrane lipoprotein-sorting protein [candidate division KSB3 bacterium]